MATDCSGRTTDKLPEIELNAMKAFCEANSKEGTQKEFDSVKLIDMKLAVIRSRSIPALS